MSAASHVAYTYRAARSDGGLEVGVIEAATREAASAALARRGLFPLELSLRPEPTAGRSRLSADDQAAGLHMLATLLESGLPMTRALAALDELAPPSWQRGVTSVRENVRQGTTLAQALTVSGLGLAPVALGIIHAGEAGSGAAPAVRRAANLAESSAATRRAVLSALAYPLILASAGLATVALLVNVVVPRFASILSDLGQELPVTTRFVLAAAEGSRVLTLPAIAATLVIALVWRMWVAQEAGRLRWHAWLLAIPIVGPVRRSTATARICTALAALLESGVPLPAAITQATKASGDAALSARLAAARERIARGERMSTAVEREHALTTTAVRLIRAGEETGRLAAMVGQAARIEGERTTQLIKNVVKLLEPALILVFGALVALVAAALMQAVYSVRPV